MRCEDACISEKLLEADRSGAYGEISDARCFSRCRRGENTTGDKRDMEEKKKMWMSQNDSGEK